MHDFDGGMADVAHDKRMELIVGVYVDDLIITGAHVEDIDSFKRKMVAHF